MSKPNIPTPPETTSKSNFVRNSLILSAFVFLAAALSYTLYFLNQNKNNHLIYVSLNGNDNNSGKDIDEALRTISKATQIAVPGDTIYIKSGNYLNEQLRFKLSGEPDKPIVLEGYQKTPGDNPRHKDFTPESSFSKNLMPLLNGHDRSKGRAIDLSNRSNIIIKNIQIQNYKEGIIGSNAQNISIDNLYLSTFGINVEEKYEGHGIRFYPADKNRKISISNSIVRNAGAENFFISGNHNHMNNIKAYGTSAAGKNKNSTDYYIVIQGNNNIIENSYAERVGNLNRGGHPIGIKGFGDNNIVRNNEIVGFKDNGFYVRHRGVKNNLFKKNTVRNSGMGIVFRDGASSNIVEELTTYNVKRGIVFFDTKEDEGQTFSGANNVVRKSTFNNLSAYFISLSDYVYKDSYATGNIIEDCTVNGAPRLFEVLSLSKDNMIQNNTFNNIASYAYFRKGLNKENIGFKFKGNIEKNNGFKLP